MRANFYFETFLKVLEEEYASFFITVLGRTNSLLEYQSVHAKKKTLEEKMHLEITLLSPGWSLCRLRWITPWSQVPFIVQLVGDDDKQLEMECDERYEYDSEFRLSVGLNGNIHI